MLALIPARGGSKGLPGKNIRPLAGKPLIAHTIEAALAAHSISRVVISTDSPEIAAVARNYGGDVPFLRPKELATDEALAIDTYVFMLKALSASDMKSISELVVLLPTSPLRTSEDIDGAAAIFASTNADSVISYVPAPHPVQWYRRLDESGVVRPLLPDGDTLKNRQVEQPTYLPNGAIYIFKSKLLIEAKTYFSDRTYPFIMPPERSVDIDTEIDFNFAEFLLTRRHFSIKHSAPDGLEPADKI